MNLLSDIMTYFRRIVKTPSDQVLSDALVIDYINRFWLMDLSARVQLFDLKTKYKFQTTPGINKYNMPLYNTQVETPFPNLQTIAPFPVYQGFMSPAFVNGIQVPFYTQRQDFYGGWPNFTQSLPNAAQGNGGSTYSLNIGYSPLLVGHVDMTGIISTGSNQDPILGTTLNLNVPVTSVDPQIFISAQDVNGNNIVITDSGQFLSSNTSYGLLMRPGTPPLGNIALSGGYSTTSNTINYSTGAVNFTFTDDSGVPVNIPTANPINVNCYYYQQGLPLSVLFFNNTITLLPPPSNTQYIVEMDAYLSPAAFLSTSTAIPFGYMAEYIALGAARKALYETGDVEQFLFYEKFFKEQESLVWKRSQRQFTSTRTQTIYSSGGSRYGWGNTNTAGGI